MCKNFTTTITLSTVTLLAILLTGCPQAPENTPWSIGATATSNKVTATVSAGGDNLNAAFNGVPTVSPAIMAQAEIGIRCYWQNNSSSSDKVLLNIGADMLVEFAVPAGCSGAQARIEPFLVYGSATYKANLNGAIWQSNLTSAPNGTFYVDVPADGNGPGPGPNDETFTLTVNVNPANGGVISGNKSTYNKGETASVTAHANTGFKFLGWYGNCLDANSETTRVVMDGNKSVTAQFAPDGGTNGYQYRVFALSADPSKGTVTMSPSKTMFNSGESVTLTATPASGKLFDHWQGIPTDDTRSQSLTFVVTGDVTAYAYFNDGGSGSGAPTITQQPVGGALANGQLTLTVVATGAVSYQWFRNGGILTGAVSSSYVATQVGQYYCLLTGPTGLTTTTITVSVTEPGGNPPPPTTSAPKAWMDNNGVMHVDEEIALACPNWRPGQPLYWAYGDGILIGNQWLQTPGLSAEQLKAAEFQYNGPGKPLTRQASQAEIDYRKAGGLLYGNLAVYPANDAANDWAQIHLWWGKVTWLFYDNTVQPVCIAICF